MTDGIYTMTYRGASGDCRVVSDTTGAGFSLLR